MLGCDDDVLNDELLFREAIPLSLYFFHVVLTPMSSQHITNPPAIHALPTTRSRALWIDVAENFNAPHADHPPVIHSVCRIQFGVQKNQRAGIGSRCHTFV